MSACARPGDALDRLNAELELRTASCHCGAEFKYEYRGVRRQSCPACVEANKAACMKRASQKNRDRMKLQPGETRRLDHRRGNDGALDRVAKMGNAEIARAEGISPQRVQQITRTAIFRIRSNPVLKRLWGFWLAEGSPTPKAKQDLGEQLLEWALELGRWWAVHDILVEAGCPEEAREMIIELAKFQMMLKKAVTRLTEGKR